MSAAATRQILDGTPVHDFHFEGGNEHMFIVYVYLIVRCFVEYCIKTGAKGRDGAPAMFLDFIDRPLQDAVSLFPHGGSDVCVGEIMVTLIDLHDTIKQSPNGFWYNGRLYFGGHNNREDSVQVARIRIDYDPTHEFQAVAVRRLGYMFDMGAVKYHQYVCTLNNINAEWAALTYDQQCGVYREFQGALHPSCQQHLNALATQGRLDPYAIDELMGQLQDAESYITRQIEKLPLYDDESDDDDDAISWTFSDYPSDNTDEEEDDEGYH